MKLPNGNRADLGTKIEDYSLNPLHREGQHKARVFASLLGITSDNADLLRRAALERGRSVPRRQGWARIPSQRFLFV